MARKILILLFLLLLTLACNAQTENADNKVKPYSSKKPFVPGEVIVKFKHPHQLGAPGQKVKIKKLFKKNKKDAEETIDEPGIYKIKFDGRNEVYSIIDGLKNDPDVEYAEPNYIYQTNFTPSDPYFSLQWGMSKVGAPAAWDVMKGDPGIIVAIVDTGIDYNHQDLSQNIWRNTDEIPGNGIDDDNNGYIDDFIGWDFVSVPSDWVMPGEDPGPPDNDPMDVLGHGTHVAGIVAGVPNNGIGVAGMSWNCRLMPLRAGYLSADGEGYLELDDIAEAIRYAADNGADVINMSFGCMYASKLLDEAVDYAHTKECIMVSAAGNVDGYDAGKPFYPAACDHVIAVSALDDIDKISIWNLFAFSNFGDFVDISAPGTSILSSLPGNNYGYASGTSMAAPFVSGTAALVLSKHKDWDPEQVEKRLKETSDYIYGMNGQDFLRGKLGSGRVSAKRALGNLSMAITYPKPNSIISGSVVVKGSASIESFAKYKLDYSTPISPDAWSTIIEENSKPIEEGVLAIWNVVYPDGRYRLRLQVSNTSGETYEYMSGVNFGPAGEVKLSERPKCGPSPYDPHNGDFLFYYDLLVASSIDICIYDISGTVVWQKCIPADSGNAGTGGSAGENRVYWDGSTSFGESISNGAYIYMIVANDNGIRKVIGRGKFAVLKS